MHPLNADANRHRATPENGHTILLTEPNPGQKTFADYPNIIECLDKITGMYEQFRLSINLRADDFNLDDLNKWMDDFFRIEIMVFDHELSRYKRLGREELKQIFRDQISKMSPPSSQDETSQTKANDAPSAATANALGCRPNPISLAVNATKAGLDEQGHPHANLDDDEVMDQPDYDDDEWP